MLADAEMLTAVEGSERGVRMLDRREPPIEESLEALRDKQ